MTDEKATLELKVYTVASQSIIKLINPLFYYQPTRQEECPYSKMTEMVDVFILNKIK